MSKSNVSVSELSDLVKALHSASQALSNELHVLAREWESLGLSKGTFLSDEIVRRISEVKNLQDEVLETFLRVSLQSLDSENGDELPASIGGLSSWLNRIEKVLACKVQIDVQQELLRLSTFVRNLRYRKGDREEDLLSPLHQAISSLQAGLSSSGSDGSDVTHTAVYKRFVPSLLSLSRLVEQGSDIEDLEADRLACSVEGQFGKELATAALRGTLYVIESSDSEGHVAPTVDRATDRPETTASSGADDEPDLPHNREQPVVGEDELDFPGRVNEGEQRQAEVGVGEQGDPKEIGPPQSDSLQGASTERSAPPPMASGLGVSLRRMDVQKEENKRRGPPTERRPVPSSTSEASQAGDVHPHADGSKTDDAPKRVDLTPSVNTERDDSISTPVLLDSKSVKDGDGASQSCEQPIAEVGRADVDRGQAGWDSLIYHLLYQGHLSLAYHLSVSLEEAGEADTSTPPSWLLRALALSPWVLDEQNRSAIARILATEYQRSEFPWASDRHSEESKCLSLLVAAACLRPSLVAPSTGAPDLLGRLRTGDGLNSCAQYIKHVADFCEKRLSLGPGILTSIKNKAVQRGERQSLQENAKHWFTIATQVGMIFGGTRKVWLHWLKPGNLIHTLLQPVIDGKDDRDSLQLLRAQISELKTTSDIEYKVRRTEGQISNTAAGRTTGKALQRIVEYSLQAIDLAEQWTILCDQLNAEPNEFAKQQALRISQKLAPLHASCVEELLHLSQSAETPHLRAACKIAQQAVENIRLLLDPATELPLQEPNPRVLDSRELLLIPGLKVLDDWELSPSEGQRIPALIEESLRAGTCDYSHSFDSRCTQGDHVGTRLLINLADSGFVSGHFSATWNNRREQGLVESKVRLQDALSRVRDQIEDAVALGLLREKERAAFVAEVVSIEAHLHDTEEFSTEHYRIERITDDIDVRRRESVRATRERLLELEPDQASQNARAVNAVLDTGDVLTANEYIEFLRMGAPIPTRGPERDPFEEFFPDKVITIADLLDSKISPAEIVRRVKSRESFCGIELQRPSGAQTTRAAEMLQFWFKVKAAKGLQDEEVKFLLERLGFTVRSVGRILQTKTGRQTFDLEVLPLRDKTVCPVARFGSQAEGRYRLMCIWSRPSEEELLAEVGDTLQGQATIVFLFGRLSVMQRRTLGKLCRERRRSFIVLDDLLMIYLCGEVGLRLPTFFKCSLPFTFTEPFATTAGLVPPEVFFGRSHERDAVADPMGSCFIYGGRQIGKTALLMHVAREFHKPDEGRVALWVDLRAHGLGYNLDAEELASILAHEFWQLKLLTQQSSAIKLDTLLDKLKAWLNENPKRRILLLLDESDGFLSSDAASPGGAPFQITARLKRLMDETKRRFKVVFAGLHNVLRTTRLENHPLAHFGQPICIGPLLDNGEWREGRDLIVKPLKAIGYEIDDPLVTRILSQTNYFPSLIQLYCQELLRHVVSRAHLPKFKAKECPPYPLSDAIVGEAYQSTDLRKAIRDRLNWTLQLDQRYEVIANILALEMFEGDQAQFVSGYSVNWVQDQVQYWWPDGFKGKSREDILSLLEEMVGMGILRETADGSFALRSPNVVYLMGARDEIEAALTRERDRPPEYAPFSFRSAYVGSSGKPDNSRRNPLTAQQDSELRSRKNDVVVICGTSAAGLLDAIDFQHQPRLENCTVVIAEGIDRAAFRREIDKIQPKESESTTVVFISSNTPWTLEWVEDALQGVGARKQKKGWLKFAFLADPATTWHCLSDEASVGMFERTTILSLRPWDDDALRQWLEDCAFVNTTPSARLELRTATGNWLCNLQSFYRLQKGRKGTWTTSFQQLEDHIFAEDNRTKLVKEFGIAGISDSRRVVLDVLAVQEESSVVSLTADTDLRSFGEEEVRRSLKWAELLHLVERTGEDLYRIDDFVARVLRHELGLA